MKTILASFGWRKLIARTAEAIAAHHANRHLHKQGSVDITETIVGIDKLVHVAGINFWTALGGIAMQYAMQRQQLLLLIARSGNDEGWSLSALRLR